MIILTFSSSQLFKRQQIVVFQYIFLDPLVQIKTNHAQISHNLEAKLYQAPLFLSGAQGYPLII